MTTKECCYSSLDHVINFEINENAEFIKIIKAQEHSHEYNKLTQINVTPELTDRLMKFWNNSYTKHHLLKKV